MKIREHSTDTSYYSVLDLMYGSINFELEQHEDITDAFHYIDGVRCSILTDEAQGQLLMAEMAKDASIISDYVHAFEIVPGEDEIVAAWQAGNLERTVEYVAAKTYCNCL